MEKLAPSSRRQFLKLSGLAGAASLLTAHGATATSAPTSAACCGQAKNVIFLVADGLGHGTVALAHHWKLHNEQQPLNWIQLLEREGLRRAYQDTASASSPVTDSSAAASAWGCGHRINNGALNMTPDGVMRKPILSYAKQAGKATGLVTTCRVTHATPAGFAANAESRNLEDVIAQQYFEREVDVILGGGARHFKQKQEDGGVLDYIPRFIDKGYTFVQDSKQLSAAAQGSGPLIGLFAQSHIPYRIDRANEAMHQQVPGLEEMFRAALLRLDQAKDGFVLQVEGGRVDHAGHGNDTAAILHEFLEFDACLPIALEYVEQHPETLLVITTDHGTGGCQLNGAGPSYSDSGPALERVNQFKHSFEWLHSRFMQTKQFDAQAIQLAFGIEATAEQGAMVQAAIDAEVKYLSGVLIEAFGEQIRDLTAVGWTSGNHTAECVELYALGPGSESIPGFVHNNEMFGIMTAALGIQV
ncbi:alkaline phosphatase [Coraliomargarita sp. SDUM461004]|uniref:Alkaline phosphatase n=1 Tax=Thalassobacterium sedimentorum TaxID=3041258 RepID=A0ABU1APW8_9BACT|nr:alkaline phosphatase [Coraliomargarita sp. SDUM461004]MDQ8195910.1 alkaline phosphatase [Coraliomargarita sp. SDUM461004]